MSDEMERAAVGAGMTKTDGGVSMARTAETNTAAAASMARANVEARFAIARHSPRDEDTARIRILRECDRPRFADVAEYSLPRAGKAITGPTIRFAEALARHFGNIAIESVVTFENEEQRLVRCTVTDLESNTTYGQDVAIEKTVERKNAKPSDDVLGTRVTSQGHSVYVIRASEADLLAKHNAQVSRAVRTLILRLVPGDLVDEAIDRARATLRKNDAEDPQAAKRKVIDAFAGIGVMPAQLAEALGHSLDAVQPAELHELRGWFAAVRSGETTMSEIIAERKKPEEGAAPKPSTKAAKIAQAAKATAARASTPEQPTPHLHTIAQGAEAMKAAGAVPDGFESVEQWVAHQRAEAIARGEDPDA